MNQKQLTLENLKDLDFGKIATAFDAELAHVVRDCADRPGDDRARKVTIQFSLAPIQDTTGKGDCDKVAVGCEISSSVPKRRTQVYSMTPNVKGHLSFHPDLPDEPEGSTLYDEDQINKDTGEVTE